MCSTTRTRVIRWNIHCSENGHAAIIYVLAGDTYGRQLGFTPSSEWAVFDAWIDPVYDEVASMVHQLLGRTVGVSDCILSVLGVACDPAPSGRRYDFTGRIRCPVCGSQNTEYGPDDPTQFTMMSVPQVTHNAWVALTKDEQRARINEALQAAGCAGVCP